MTIAGKNLGPPAALPYVSVFYGTTSQFTMVPIAVNHSTLTAVLQPGCGAGLPVTVSVAGLASSSQNPSATVINFAPPTIGTLYTAPASGAALTQLSTLGGDDVWIDGTSLGPSSVAGSALAVSATYTGGIAGYAYAYGAVCRKDDASRAHTRVICTTGPGVSANFTWMVRVCGQASAPSVQMTSYTRPTLLGVSGPGAVNAATEGGQSITVLGTSFGPLSSSLVQGTTPTVTSVEYGAPTGTGAWRYAPACVVTGMVPATLACLSTPGTGTNLSWRVAIGGQPSNVLPGASSYGAPVVSQFLGDAAVAGPTVGGTNVTLSGFNFGADPSVLSVSYAATLAIPRASDGTRPGVNGTVVFTPPACTITIPHHALECTLAAGAGTLLKWMLVVDGQTSTAPYTSFAPPLISGVALLGGAVFASPDGGVSVPTEAWDAGNCPWCPFPVRCHPQDSALLTGENFASRELIQRVRYGPTGVEFKATSITNISDSALQVTLGPGIGNVAFTVTVADQVSPPSATALSFSPPTVLAVSPRAADASDGSSQTLITVSGINFGLLVASAVLGVGFGNPGDGSFVGPLPIIASYPSAADLRAPNFSWVPGAPQWIQFVLPPGLGANRSIRIATYPSGSPPSRAAVLSLPTSLAAMFSFNRPRVDNIVVLSITSLADAAAITAAFPAASPDDMAAARIIAVFGASMGPSASLTGDSVLRAIDFQPVAGYSAAGPWDSDAVVITNWTNTRVDGYCG